MAVVLPHLSELDLGISKSDLSKPGLGIGPMRVTSARSRAFRRTPLKKKALNNPITKPNKANDASRLTSLAEKAPTTAPAPAPFTFTAVPWPPKYILPPNSVTPIVDEAPTVRFSDGQPSLSPLYLKRKRILGCTIGNPEYDDILPTEFIIGPMPGPPTPRKSKSLVGTSGKRACGTCSRNSIRPLIAPRKWPLPLRFPSTCSLPIWTRHTEWDDDDDDDDDDKGNDDKDDYADDDDYDSGDKDKISGSATEYLLYDSEYPHHDSIY